MIRFHALEPRFVVAIPQALEPAVLYVSMEYGTVAHSCCCGCGLEVITPLTPTDWHLSYDGEGISLWPSVGNWNFPCQSHYVITQNRVVESGGWSTEQIEAERSRNRAAKQDYYNSKYKEVSESSSNEPAHAAPVSSAKDPREQYDSWWGRLRRRLGGGGR